MIKQIVRGKLKEYGKSLFEANIRQDLDSMYGIAQGLTEHLSPATKTFARNALDCLMNSIHQIAGVNNSSGEKEGCEDKKVIDAKFKVKNNVQ